MPLRWRNPDVNNDGIVDIYDFSLVEIHYGDVGESPYDMNYNGIVDLDDIMYVGSWLGRPRPNDNDLPVLPDIYTLKITCGRLSWFSESAFLGIVDTVIVPPALVVLAALGYEYTGRSIGIQQTTVDISLNFRKFASSSPAIPAAIWGAIAIGILLGVGAIIIGIAWIYQARVEEQKTVSAAETKAKLAEELEAGLITQEQYTTLMAKLLEEEKANGVDWFAMLTQALPLLLGLAVVGAVIGFMPKRRD